MAAVLLTLACALGEIEVS